MNWDCRPGAVSSHQRTTAFNMTWCSTGAAFGLSPGHSPSAPSAAALQRGDRESGAMTLPTDEAHRPWRQQRSRNAEGDGENHPDAGRNPAPGYRSIVPHGASPGTGNVAMPPDAKG